MARYLKLGASRNSDRDTSLFVDPPEEPPNDSGKPKLCSGSWSILRRAQSTRERRSVQSYSSPAAPDAPSKRNPREFEKNVEEKFDEQVRTGNYSLRRAKSSRERESINHQVSDKISERFTTSKQLIKPPVSLVRAQSLRYNRIVSADEEDDSVVVLPPRHSCSVERTIISEDRNLLESSSPMRKIPKRTVRVSASYQTREGEILSIECSECGRWLGTVGRRVNVEEGLVKLCQICHPAVEQRAGDESFKAAAGIVLPVAAGGVAVGGSREDLKRNNTSAASGFFRGLRKMLGLKRTSGR